MLASMCVFFTFYVVCRLLPQTCMYVVPRGGLPWKRRKLQQPSVGDLDQKHRSCAVKLLSGSSSSNNASSDEVLASPGTTNFKLACSAPAELHQAVGMLAPRGRSQAGPTPTQEIVLLEDLARRNFPIDQILGSIASARAQAAVAKTTSTTYASHVRMIHWACRTLDQPPLPASLQLISRVAALINNPNTQRGWLAAWRDWQHVRERVPWAGDADLFLKKLRKGTARLAPETPPKPRLQLQWWSKLLKLAARNQQVEFGTVCNLAYTLAARVPSEIFKQLSWSKLSVGDRCLVYSNVYRKGKPHPCTLRRWCVCVCV